MKIYFYAPDVRSSEAAAQPRAIVDILARAGMEVMTKDTDVATAFPDTYRQVQERGQTFLDHVSALIIEGTNPDPEVGYLLAYAIAQKKPALLLTHKGHARHNPLETFGKQHRLPPTLVQVGYDEGKLESVLLHFLQQLDHIDYIEVPSIKFTLRITPQIERYLHWKTHNTQMTKADFLRKILLEEIIARDEHYQRFRKKRSAGNPS